MGVFRAMYNEDHSSVEPLAKSLCELAEVQSFATRSVREAESSKVLLIEAYKNSSEAVSMLETSYSKNPRDLREKVRSS